MSDPPPASSETSREAAPSAALARVVGVPGAVLMGLGSILGTGIFVSLGLAADLAGPAVVLAVPLAAALATLNGLSSAALAASHPVSGGTYEYGYRYLSPALGFVAGWLFVCAKSASAAAAALGLAGYALSAFGVASRMGRIGLALALVGGLTVLVAGGLGRSSRANALIVSLTLAALLAFVLVGAPGALANADRLLVGPLVDPAARPGADVFLHATALLFVAYTGYGRIATLGEEVRDPLQSIPRAIVITLVLTALLYAAVALVAVGAVGAPRLALETTRTAAPLAVIAPELGGPALAWLVRAGALSAMLGVLLNLLLGLSRVVLAMARRGDLPGALARVDAVRASPRAAVYAVGGLIALLSAGGRIETAWSFSAFTVLVYYALTHLAALRLPVEARRHPRWVAVLGLIGCLGLAFRVEPRVWASGIGLIGVGLVWHFWRRGRRRAR